MIPLLLMALQAESALEEIDGRLVFEVETAARGSWTAETALAGYTGKGYLTWTGPDLFGAPGKEAISWSLQVNRPGRYLLLLRNRHDFADSTLQNDCFTKMDEGSWTKTFSSTRGTWTWATRHELESGKPPAAYDLEVGLHHFQISGRSKGFSIDRIHLVREGAVGGEDSGAPPSPTVFEAMAGPGPHDPATARKLRSGRGAGELLRGLRGKSGDPMLAAMTAFLERRSTAARALEPADKVARLADLAVLFAGDAAGAALESEVEALRADPVVQRELKAAALWRKIEEAQASLRPKDRKAALEPSCRRLVELYPGTLAARRAEALFR